MDRLLKSNNLHRMFAKGIKRTYHKGQTLQTSVDEPGLIMVIEGFVKCYFILNDGSIGVQAIYGPGTIFPMMVALKLLFGEAVVQSHMIYYYSAMNDVVTYNVSQNDFLSCFKNDSELYKDLLEETSFRFVSNVQRIENRSIESAYCRLAHQLYYFAEKYGKNTQAGTVILIPLTQQDLADILALARETITKCMARLRSHDIITHDKAITIPDLDKLKAIAY